MDLRKVKNIYHKLLKSGAYPAVCQRGCKNPTSSRISEKSNFPTKNTTIKGRIPTKSIFFLPKSDNKVRN